MATGVRRSERGEQSFSVFNPEPGRLVNSEMRDRIAPAKDDNDRILREAPNGLRADLEEALVPNAGVGSMAKMSRIFHRPEGASCRLGVIGLGFSAMLSEEFMKGTVSSA